MQKFFWEDQFLTSVSAFAAAGVSAARATSLLKDYIRLAHETPLPAVLDFSSPNLHDASPYVPRNKEIHDLMLAIFDPLLSGFTLSGRENFLASLPALEQTGITIVCNHLSLFDAAVVYALLHRDPELMRYAERMFFITGRLVFTSDFSRVAGLMFQTMLVASPRDMAENEAIKRELMRLNMRSFKEAKERQKKGEPLVLYPEGTRSRDGMMKQFHAALFNYIEGTTVLPVALEGPEKILHAESFSFGLTAGKMTIGKPVFIGSSTEGSEGIMALDPNIYSKESRKQGVMDALGQRVAAMLPQSMRGFYA